MKQLTMSDVKSKSFNLVSMIESLSTYDLNDKEKTKKEISEAIYESESLVEAIIFKKEKLKKGIEDQKENFLIEQTNKLKENISGSYLGYFDSSFSILGLKKRKDELVRIKNIIRYSLQMEGQEEKILESLFNSEDIENWRLLAYLINCHLLYTKGVNTLIFSSFSKKLEILLINTFRTSIANEDFSGCKVCFDILKILEKELVLLDEFLVHKELISSDSAVVPPVLTKFSLESGRLENNSFEDFLNEKLALVEESFQLINKMFGVSVEYNDYIVNKILKTLIYRKLNDFLSANNSPVFLTCIESAYLSLVKFITSLKALFPTIKVDVLARELMASFTYNSIYHEKALFDEVLEIQLQGTKVINEYEIKNKILRKTSDYEKIFQNMSVLVDRFLYRSSLLYTREEESELLELFLKKIGSVIDLMTSSCTDQLKLINGLIEVYKIFAKIFKKNFAQLKAFKNKIQASIEVQFESFIELTIQQLKKKVNAMSFQESGLDIEVTTLIEEVFHKTTSFDEKNINILSFRLFLALYDIIYKHILNISNLSDKKLRNLHAFVDDVYKSFPISSSSEFVNKIRKIKKFSELLIASSDEYRKTISDNVIDLTKAEMNDLRKYRQSRFH